MLKLEVQESATLCCAPIASESISEQEADTVARKFKALADPARIRILSIVASSPEQEACVCDLQEPLGLSQPTVSHHLKVLSQAGFLTRSQRGSWAYYSLIPGALEAVSRALVDQ